MKLTITIECTPKRGRADRLHETITAAVRKHAKKRGLNIHTQYHQEEE